MILSKLSNKRLAVYVRFMLDLAKLSKCEDKKQAAVIIDSDGSQVYSIGINGGPKGGAQCLCHGSTKYTCIHAEANALVKCHVQDQHKVMLATMSPCVTCAALIINSGFDEVYYVKEYKDLTGIKMLRDAGVKAYKLSDFMWEG